MLDEEHEDLILLIGQGNWASAYDGFHPREVQHRFRELELQGLIIWVPDLGDEGGWILARKARAYHEALLNTRELQG